MISIQARQDLFDLLQAEEEDGWHIDMFGVGRLAREFFSEKNDCLGQHTIDDARRVSSTLGLASLSWAMSF